MTKGRKTTQTERIAVAKDCIASGKNYGEIATKYNVILKFNKKWTIVHNCGMMNSPQTIKHKSVL